MIIYKKLLNIAYRKEIKIGLEFDNILKDNTKYQQLKYGNQILNELRQI